MLLEEGWEDEEGSADVEAVGTEEELGFVLLDVEPDGSPGARVLGPAPGVALGLERALARVVR